MQIEKNVAIAEMLGVKQEEWYPPNKDMQSTGIHLVFPQNTWYPDNKRQHCDSLLKFDTDANWQFEAIDFCERENFLPNTIVEFIILCEGCSVNVRSADKGEQLFFWFSGYEKIRGKKPTIFEALYQFSQYLKQK